MALLVALTLALHFPSAQGEAGQLADHVQSLVRQLNAPDLAQRQVAEESLLELGPPALDHLPRSTDQFPAEVQQRLIRVRNRLESSAVSAVLQPSRVTLQGEMTVAQAIRQLQQQTGNRITGDEGRPGRLKLDLRNVVFWNAIDQILDQAQLDVNSFAGQPQTLVLASRPPGGGSRCDLAAYQEVFRFQPVRVEAKRDLRTPDTNALRVTVEVSWEPRLQPISLRQRLDAVSAWDENGQPLALAVNQGAINATAESGISMVEMALPLQLPGRQVKRLSRLTATIDAMLPGRTESFEFADLGKIDRAVSQRRASVRVTLVRWRKNSDLYEAVMRIQYDDPGSALDSHRGWIYKNQAYLIGPDGKRIDDVGTDLIQQRSEEVELAYLFDLEGGDERYRLVYETPAAIQRVSVPYELREIPLP